MARLASLDGLRGVAAIAVVAEHVLLTAPPMWRAFLAGRPKAWDLADLLTYTPLHLAWAGGEAVAIFYVLSGLVLSLPFWAGRQPGYGAYVVQRLFRLWPVYLFAAALSGALYFAAARPPPIGVSAWFRQYWAVAPTAMDALRAALFMPGDLLKLNSPFWTLIHELRISMALPFILLAVRRWPAGSLIAGLGLSCAARIALGHGFVPPGDLANLAETLVQVWYFVAGALLARHWPAIGERLARTPAWAVACAGAASLVLLLAQWLTPAPSTVAFVCTGVGAVGVVALVGAAPRLRGLFSKPVATGLGAISYPLYALHFPLIVAAVLVFTPMTGNVQLAAVAGAAIALALAGLTTLALERPMMALGRRLTHRLPDAGVTAAPAAEPPKA